MPEGPLFHKPKSIVAAKNILYAIVFISVISSLIAQFTTNQHNFTSIWGLSATLLNLILLIFLAHQIGLGKMWARTVLLVLFLLAMAVVPLVIGLTFHDNIVLVFLFVLQMLLEIGVLIFLYNKSSNNWFKAVAAVKQ